MVSERDLERVVGRELGEEVKAFRDSGAGRAHEGFFVECDSGRYFLKIGDDEERFQVEGPALELLNERTEVSGMVFPVHVSGGRLRS